MTWLGEQSIKHYPPWITWLAPLSALTCGVSTFRGCLLGSMPVPELSLECARFKHLGVLPKPLLHRQAQSLGINGAWELNSRLLPVLLPWDRESFQCGTVSGVFHPVFVYRTLSLPWTLRACLGVLTIHILISFTPRLVLLCLGKVVLYHRAHSFKRDENGCLASRVSQMNPGHQRSDWYHSQTPPSSPCLHFGLVSMSGSLSTLRNRHRLKGREPLLSTLIQSVFYRCCVEIAILSAGKLRR